jgi:hypothetical protein
MLCNQSQLPVLDDFKKDEIIVVATKGKCSHPSLWLCSISTLNQNVPFKCYKC